jgi:hypothetical protein
VRKNYQRKERKSNHKFEVVRGQELLVRAPLPMAEVWAEMQAQVEELTGQAGLQILRAILENEVTRRVGPPHPPNPTAGCVRWGKQSGYVVFGGQKIPLERPRVRTREGQEVELESYGKTKAHQIFDGSVLNAHNLIGLNTRVHAIRSATSASVFAIPATKITIINGRSLPTSVRRYQRMNPLEGFLRHLFLRVGLPDQTKRISAC